MQPVCQIEHLGRSYRAAEAAGARLAVAGATLVLAVHGSKIDSLARKRTVGVARTVPYPGSVRDVAVHYHVAMKEHSGTGAWGCH